MEASSSGETTASVVAAQSSLSLGLGSPDVQSPEGSDDVEGSTVGQVVRLQEELDGMKQTVKQLQEEVDRLKHRVKELEENQCLHTQNSRIRVVAEIARMESDAFYEEIIQCMHEGKEFRKLDQLLALREGQVSHRPYNPVVRAFVEELTKHQSDTHTSQHILQQEAMECLRGARHHKYVSDFHIALQAVSYAVSGSRLVVDMIGHAGPGGSYTLVKEWLLQLSSSPLQVPSGMLVVAFDNEQRLLKNYLSRGANRSRIDVLTNIICAVFGGKKFGAAVRVTPKQLEKAHCRKAC